MARKLCWLCAMFFLGIALYSHSVFLSAILGAALIFYCIFTRKRQKFLLILFVVFCLGTFHISFFDARQSAKVAPFLYDTSSFSGRIVSCPEDTESGQRFYVETGNFKIRLSTNTKDLTYGDMIDFSAVLARPDPAGSDIDFDYASYLKSHGVFATAYTEDVTKTGSDVRLYRPVDLANVLRRNMLLRVDEHFSGDTRMLLRAVLVGDKTQMSDDMREILSNSGISHIAAVSGMHVSIIMTLLCTMLTPLFGRKKRFAGLLVLPVILLFVLITGASPSTVRAGLMLALYVIGRVFLYDYDGLTALSFSAIVLLIVNPFYAFDASFLLSFSATAGISVFFTPVCERLLFIRPKFLREVLATTICAQVFTLPFVAYFFRYCVVLGLITNLIAVPLLPFIMGLGFVTIFVPFIAPVTGFVCNLLCKIVLWCAKFIGKLPGAVFWIRKDSVAYLLIIYLCLLAVFILIFKTQYRRRAIPLLFAAAHIMCAVMLIASILPRNGVTISFINIGQGDCTLIQGKNASVMIDCGATTLSENYDPALDTAVPYMQYHGTDVLDGLFVTHYDTDHAGGALTLVKTNRVKNLFLPYEDMADEYYRELILAAYSTDTNVYILDKRNTRVSFGELSFLVLSEFDKELDSSNDRSLVLKLSYEDNSVLFCGDTTKKGEQALLDAGVDLSCDILKVAHHGSKTSSGIAFLKKANPEHAVIFADFSTFPNTEIVNRLTRAGARVWVTKSDGAITIELTEGAPALVNSYWGNIS